MFDIERFTSFEGNTGPYILYTIVRIKSILSKYQAKGGSIEGLSDAICQAKNAGQKNLMLSLAKFNATIEMHMKNPHHIKSVHTFMNSQMHLMDFITIQEYLQRRMINYRNHT